MSATLSLPDALARTAARHVVSLAEPLDVSDVGGKAATLSRLMSLGVAVPRGVVIRVSAFNEYRARHEPMTTGALDGALRSELLAAVEPLLREGAVVVRSSAVGEDSAQGSFAGQLDSILHVRSAEALERAVLDCWASYWSERAVFYRRARGLPLRGMGVIVQQQVVPRAAGVLFTDAGNGELMFEYAPGLADALVAGAIDPGRLTVDRRTGAVTRLAALGGEHAEVDALMSEPARLAELTALADRLEQALGGPQDVEWALDTAGTVQVVQSRPITAALHAPARVPAATPTRAARVAWSNANVNENFPDPISPLLYSVASAGYTHYFRNLATAFGISRTRIRAMDPSFRRIIGVHGARMYYNLTSIHRVLRLAPFGDALAHAFDTFVGAHGQDDTPHDVPASGALSQRLEVAVIALKTTWQYLFLPVRVARFERTVDSFAARTHPARLDVMSLGELRDALAGFMEIRLHRWNDAALADAASMVCYAALERALATAYRDAPRRAVHTTLLKAIPDVVSSKPVVALWELSRAIRGDAALAELFSSGNNDAVLEAIRHDERFAAFRRQFDDYLERWGFRCSSELMLTAPSFQEAPAPLVGVLAAYARLDGESPVDALRRQAAEREMETQLVMADLRGRGFFGRFPLPTYAQVVRLLLGWTHASIRFRERARLKQALLYSRCRRIALALGAELARRDLLARAEDAFWLTTHELDEIASGGAMFPAQVRELVALRAAAHAAQCALVPPDSFELDEGEYWRGSAVPAASITAERPRGVSHTGVSACAGSVTGRAAVLRDVTEATRLARGDVLVTRQTDPGWGPAFFLIAGLVIERGGMLSHGAIIAREFGIPCVVGVRDATSAIPDGATVTVDGDRGLVHVD